MYHRICKYGKNVFVILKNLKEKKTIDIRCSNEAKRLAMKFVLEAMKDPLIDGFVKVLIIGTNVNFKVQKLH